MNSKTLYFGMLGLVALMLCSLLGGAYGLDRMISTQAKELSNTRLQLAVLDQQQTELTKARQDIKKYNELATIARSVVPEDKDQAQTVDQIVTIANANNIPLNSVTFPSSTLGTKGTGSANLSQLIASKDIPGVYSLQLTVVSDPQKPVPYTKFISFLSALEHNRRTALVQSVNIQPSERDRSTLSFTLILNEYIKP